MPPAEQPLGETPIHPSGDRRPLYLRMYFQAHLSDLVRAIGYDTLPLDEARDRCEALVVRYGEALMDAAGNELLLVDSTQNPAVVRLSDDACRLARMLLGPPPSRDATATVTVAPSPTGDSIPPIAATNSADGHSHNRSRPRKRPKTNPGRAEFFRRFSAWLTEHGENYSVPTDDRWARVPAELLRDVDFIVRKNDRQLLVAVRRTLHPKQVASLMEAELHFGAGTTAVRVWPEPSEDGWTWQKHPVVADNSPPPKAND